MEAAGHFIFELIKIAILAGVYAWLLLLVFRAIFKPKSRLYELTIIKLKFWKTTAFKIACVLFIFMFTPWGNHGLGDSARIPVGNFKEITNTNWTTNAYLRDVETKDGIPIETTLFTVANNHVLGNLDSHFYSFKNNYFIYNVSSGELIEFASGENFNNYATQRQLPKLDMLQTFNKNYDAYWRGWRFWLLP